MPKLRYVLWGAVALALVAAGSLFLTRADTGTTPSASSGEALVGGPFTLTDHTGARVSDRDFRGRFMLIYFGFTYCPDVCPAELARMEAVINAMGPAGEMVVPILLSVDPERDTPEVLANYVKHFHPRTVGLTGTPDEIRDVLSAYRVYAQKVEQPGSSVGYLMDHSSYIYLMGPDGKFVDFYAPQDSPEEIRASLTAHVGGR